MIVYFDYLEVKDVYTLFEFFYEKDFEFDTHLMFYLKEIDSYHNVFLDDNDFWHTIQNFYNIKEYGL